MNRKKPKIVLIPTMSLPISKLSIYIPLGLLAIKSYIKEHADVEIVDMTVLVKRGILQPDDTFYVMAAEYLKKLQADLYAFSTKSGSLIQTIKIAETLKLVMPTALVAFGGPQATACDEEILKDSQVDFIIRGEGEIPFEHITEALMGTEELDDICSLTFRNHKNSDAERICEMDNLPIPSYDEYRSYYEDYLEGKPEYDIQSYVPIDSARGCPSNCKFCYSPIMWKRECRVKSAERLIKEIEYLYKEFNISSVFFTEDNFTVSRQRVIDFCNALIDKNLPIKWNCYSRIDTIDYAMIDIMEKAGCRQIYYGIESGSSKILNLLKKAYSINTALSIVSYSLKKGIYVTASFILGFPEETAEDISVTLNAFFETVSLGAASKLHLLGVEYGTPLYQEVKDCMIFCPPVPIEILKKDYLIDREMYCKIAQNKRLYSYFYTYEQGIFTKNWVKSFRLEYNYEIFENSINFIRKSQVSNDFLMEHLMRMIDRDRNHPIGNSLESKVSFFMETLLSLVNEKKIYEADKKIYSDFENWKNGKSKVKKTSKTL